MLVDKQPIKELNEGEYFGDIAILYGCNRSAGIRAKTKTFLWALDRADYNRYIRELRFRSYKENRKFVEQVRFFGIFFFI